MKVSFTIPEDKVNVAAAMIRAKVEDADPQEKQAVEQAITVAKDLDCVQLNSAEVFDDQQTVVLVGLAVAAITACLNTK